MVRPKSLVPSYLLHKPSGQARVRLNGKDHYLGPYGSEDSRRRYGELIANYAAGKPVDPFVPAGGGDASASLSVSELLLAFLDFAEGHYVKGGKPTDEVHCYRAVIRMMSELYGSTFVDRFGPNDLRAVRQAMIDADWSLGYIQRQINRVRHIFRWGVGRDMVPPAVHQKLCAVEPLQ
ncbi:MAG TPA: hypothetical protein VFG20_18100, partial [Planctomycetaceae bacterium]|nr:hypothetical protein [Planctomycetaceae bacterium]